MLVFIIVVPDGEADHDLHCCGMATLATIIIPGVYEEAVLLLTRDTIEVVSLLECSFPPRGGLISPNLSENHSCCANC